MTRKQQAARKAARAAQFREDLFRLALSRVGRNVAFEIRDLDDAQLLALRQRARWDTRRALQYLLVYGCRVVRRGIDV